MRDFDTRSVGTANNLLTSWWLSVDKITFQYFKHFNKWSLVSSDKLTIPRVSCLKKLRKTWLNWIWNVAFIGKKKQLSKSIGFSVKVLTFFSWNWFRSVLCFFSTRDSISNRNKHVCSRFHWRSNSFFFSIGLYFLKNVPQIPKWSESWFLKTCESFTS